MIKLQGLEVDDPISSSYILEVSSGGLSRPLTCLDDYSFFLDSKIKITLKEKFLGKITYKGIISDVDENQNIILKTYEHEIKVNFLEIESGNIDPEWAIENNKIN